MCTSPLLRTASDKPTGKDVLLSITWARNFDFSFFFIVNMQGRMKHGRTMELPEDFWVPIPLETDNITSLSPFFVPQDHLGARGLFYGLAAFMAVLSVGGISINVLTIACTAKYKKLRSHLNFILLNLALANLLVSFFGSSIAAITFACRYFVFGPLACKIEGFMATLGGKT